MGVAERVLSAFLSAATPIDAALAILHGIRARKVRARHTMISSVEETRKLIDAATPDADVEELEFGQFRSGDATRAHLETASGFTVDVEYLV